MILKMLLEKQKIIIMEMELNIIKILMKCWQMKYLIKYMGKFTQKYKILI